MFSDIPQSLLLYFFAISQPLSVSVSASPVHSARITPDEVKLSFIEIAQLNSLSNGRMTLSSFQLSNAQAMVFDDWFKIKSAIINNSVTHWTGTTEIYTVTEDPTRLGTTTETSSELPSILKRGGPLGWSLTHLKQGFVTRPGIRVDLMWEDFTRIGQINPGIAKEMLEKVYMTGPNYEVPSIPSSELLDIIETVDDPGLVASLDGALETATLDSGWETVTTSSGGLVVESTLDAEAVIPGALDAAQLAAQKAELADMCNILFGPTRAVELPTDIMQHLATISTEGELSEAGVMTWAEGVPQFETVTAEALAAADAGTAEGVLLGTAATEAVVAEGAADGVIIAADAGLLAAGPLSLGLSIGIAAALTAAGFVVMPLIESLKDRRKTVKLHGFIMDVDGDGKPEHVNDYMSKLTPNNQFLYHKVHGVQTFFNHLFKKKEVMNFDFDDEAMGHVTFKWKGDAFSGQTAVLGVVKNMSLTAEQKTQNILEILAGPNKGGNKKHDKFEIKEDLDHDGLIETIKIKSDIKNIYDGKLKIEGDIDGDSLREKCKWKDGVLETCEVDGHDDHDG